MTRPVWTTMEGKRIPYKQLTDDHLKNIIRDGYRNNHLDEEAKRRGFEYPDRLVDKLTPPEVVVWVEAFASCAMEGNQSASYLMKLWQEHSPKFYLNLNKILEQTAREESNGIST